MKRILALIMALLMALSFAACAEEQAKNPAENVTTVSGDETTASPGEQETTEAAVETTAPSMPTAEDLFYDSELQYLFITFDSVNSKITAQALLYYYSQKSEDRKGDPFHPSSEAVFTWLSQRFKLTSALKKEMKEFDDYYAKYNKAEDNFEMTFQGTMGSVDVLGYVQNGDNSDTVYYEFTPWENYGIDHAQGYWKVKVERPTEEGKPSRYLSLTKVDKVPGDLTK